MEFKLDDKVKVVGDMFSPSFVGEIGEVIDIVDNQELVGGKEIIVHIDSLDETIDGDWPFFPSELEKIWTPWNFSFMVVDRTDYL